MIFAILALSAIGFQEPEAPKPVHTPKATAAKPAATKTAGPKTTGKVQTTEKQQVLETLFLGSNRTVRGVVLKETDSAVYVDIGFDVLKIPAATIVRRTRETKKLAGRTHDKGLFLTAERPERSIVEGASQVGEAVVKIETPTGSGSGFITNAEGYIVTNFHVTEGFDEVDVVLYLKTDKGLDKRTLRKNKVLAINPLIDLALVKITPPKDVALKHVYLGDSEKARVGDRVYAIGAPIGLERTVSAGIISVTNRSFGGQTRLQITTPINPGNSGGPLFNLRAEVVGVNSSGYTGMQGLNFAIPSKYVKDFLRNRDAFALDTTRSEKGVHYLPAPRKPKH